MEDLEDEEHIWNTRSAEEDGDKPTIDTGKCKDDELWRGQVLKRQLYFPKIPYPLWDYNWDGRMTPETTLEAQSQDDDEPIGTTRHIILVRHGQYEERFKVCGASQIRVPFVQLTESWRPESFREYPGFTRMMSAND